MLLSVSLGVIRIISFYRAMLRRARYCYGKLSVRNVEVL